jgi:DNA-binding CsgD family transcriptional regulator
MDIKDRLVQEITLSGLSTVEIARRIGVSPEMVTQYKTTAKLPSLTVFAALCKAIDASANYILGLDRIEN